MNISLDAEFDHEKLIWVSDRATGLLAALAIHSTALGPAVGGMRYRHYDSVSSAALDALRLGRAMTLKNAAADLGWGGGKLCVIDDGDVGQRHARVLKIADIINDLKGEYIVGKDLGVTMNDMQVLSSRSKWVVGIPEGHGGLGDPSPATARTVLGAMEAASKVLWGNDGIRGRSASIIGAGGVGGSLARLLADRGVTLWLADTDSGRAREVATATGGRVLATADALTVEADFLAPCATGQMIGLKEAAQLRCRVIAAGANNPLTDDDSVAGDLHRRHITYVPDFLSNAGGVIQNAAEFRRQGMNMVNAMIERNSRRLLSLLERARDADCPPLDLARAEALARVAEGRHGPRREF